MVIQTQVAQKHGAREDHGSGVSLVLALDIEADMATTRLKHGNIAAHVAARNQAGSADKSGTNVGKDATVKVRHHHHVELLGSRDSLHGRIVDDHIINFQSGVGLSNLVESAAEQTVGQFHDVGLVDTGDLLSVVRKGKSKGELGNTFRLGTGDDLKRLDNTLHRLVFKTRIFSLGVFTNDAEIDIFMACLVARDVLYEDDGRKDVELLAQSNVERLMAGAFHRSEQDTLKAQLVATERRDRLLEKFLRVLISRINATDVYLFPLDRNIVGFENSLDRFGNFGTDTVTLIAKAKKARQRVWNNRVGSTWTDDLYLESG